MSFNQFYQQQPIGTTTAYTQDSTTPINVEVYQPAPKYVNVKFPNLMGGKKVTVPAAPLGGKSTETSETPAPKKRGRKKKSESTDIIKSEQEEPINETDSKYIVENTVYADTYRATNNMTYGIISQTDELLRDCKQELEYLKAQRALKGKYKYVNDTINSMGTLLNTKLAAVKEINSTIKTINDNEYRRFKDFRALNTIDDNKAVMDAYSAFISAPVGAPEYRLPGTTNLTAGLNGIVQAGYPNNIQANMDAGMANYMAHLTPEENLMLNDSNKDIEEVIVYDQATGAKYFQWMNTRTGEIIPNMPVSSELTIEDFTIDPRTKLAKNSNLNCIKKVVVLNEGAFDRF